MYLPAGISQSTRVYCEAFEDEDHLIESLDGNPKCLYELVTTAFTPANWKSSPPSLKEKLITKLASVTKMGHLTEQRAMEIAAIGNQIFNNYRYSQLKLLEIKEIFDVICLARVHNEQGLLGVFARKEFENKTGLKIDLCSNAGRSEIQIDITHGNNIPDVMGLLGKLLAISSFPLGISLSKFQGEFTRGDLDAFLTLSERYGSYIQVLNLSAPTLQNSDLQKFFNNCSNLRCVMLTSSLVTEKGLRDLNKLKELRQLFLVGCCGVASLPNFFDLPQDCVITLSRTGISEAIKNELRQKINTPGYVGPSMRCSLPVLLPGPLPKQSWLSYYCPVL